MKLLANENIPLASVLYLRANGFDVLYIAELFKGITDIEVLQLANEQERIIITFDQDYGTLIFQNGFKPPFGVIFLRFTIYAPIEPGQIIEKCSKLNYLNFSYTFTVIDERSIRQKQYK